MLEERTMGGGEGRNQKWEIQERTHKEQTYSALDREKGRELATW